MFIRNNCFILINYSALLLFDNWQDELLNYVWDVNLTVNCVYYGLKYTVLNPLKNLLPFLYCVV